MNFEKHEQQNFTTVWRNMDVDARGDYNSSPCTAYRRDKNSNPVVMLGVGMVLRKILD